MRQETAALAFLISLAAAGAAAEPAIQPAERAAAEAPAGQSAPPAAAPAAAPYKLQAGPHATQVAPQFILHDAARKKDLPVTATFPKDGGPLPVIIFSHGAGGSSNAYVPLVRHWAGHGYICLAPTHADSLALAGKTREAGGGVAGVVNRALSDPDGWVNRARDVSFLINALAEVQEKVPALRGRTDAKRLGVGGHSYGALTTQLVAGATIDLPGGEKGKSLADPRPLAFLLLSGQGTGQMGLTERSWAAVHRPMMVMTGTRDRGARGQDWQWRPEPFKFSPPPDKFCVVIEGANHMSFTGRLAEADGAGAAESGPGRGALVRALLAGALADAADQKAVFDAVKVATLAFWDAYLKGDRGARAWLKSDALPAWSNGAVRLERK